MYIISPSRPTAIVIGVTVVAQCRACSSKWLDSGQVGAATLTKAFGVELGKLFMIICVDFRASQPTKKIEAVNCREELHGHAH